VLGRRIPVQMAVTTAMPNWEEEMFDVALISIWGNKCCNAIETRNFFDLPIKQM
jgi:hypothetical protein